jgi:hypothetical protein
MDTTVRMLEFDTRVPVANLCEDLYGGFSLGQAGLLGERVLSDHIGYRVQDLGRLTSVDTRLGIQGDWFGTMLYAFE